MLAALAPYANYSEKQFLKRGEIAECVEAVLTRRR